MTANGERPLLAVDVDGVISLFGFEAGPLEAPGEFHYIDGIVHCISRATGERLRRLAETYELFWATGWEERANEYLVHILGLPAELPVLRFDEPARLRAAHWKLSAIDRYAGQRPLAWIDDSIDDECVAWSERRAAPTLLVPTESDRGLEEGHVEALIGWAEAGYTP